MTAPALDRSTPKDTPRPPSYGTKEDFLAGRKLRYKDVEIAGKLYRVRELRQVESENISRANFEIDVDGKGQVSQKFDGRGNKARTIAYAWVHPDEALTPMFTNPAEEWQKVNQLTADFIDPMYEAVDSLSPESTKAREALGKDLAKATS